MKAISARATTLTTRGTTHAGVPRVWGVGDTTFLLVVRVWFDGEVPSWGPAMLGLRATVR
ncbi:MAG: hypothetical protein CVT68_08990 [Actinobacteria bacterium HGW-Actinobacteria-8]|nr:MAG: hypothetical protein CVT68_08990 [Actinobacteria bacterium HGW-Actinobacteria-8]